MEELPNVMFVRLEEEITFKREAKTYLRRLAMKNGIKNCSSLLGCLAPSDSGYLTGRYFIFGKSRDHKTDHRYVQ